MITVGMMPGRSMCHTRRQMVAPSTRAASCSSTSTPASAARKMIVPQPMFCQMPVHTYTWANQSGLPRNGGSGRPSLASATLTRPMRVCSSFRIMPTITTVEMKCGA